ncbi:MAG: AraC family transcriptional regulator [Clostridia bacterium]|nr:AraC family transcriptional regulator [Clostridia bacterium]
MFYESANSLLTDQWKIEHRVDFQFPLHLHSSFEWITLREGEMCVTVDGVLYRLRSGDALLIFPNQVHSFETPVHSAHSLCIFSSKLVQAYSKHVQNKIPQSNLFTPDRYSAERLIESARATVPMSEFQIKGLLYSLCGEFDRTATYVERHGERDELLAKIFRFVESNYDKDCSLEALAAHTNYHYVYLSRYFKQCTKLSYTDYVNRYRVNEAGYILKNTGQTVLQTAYNCGFESLRSFNRNFKRVTGITPMEYRENDHRTGVEQ